jgi:hypothetical protein
MNSISNPFKTAESCMFGYLENLARLDALRDDLRLADARSSLKTPNYDGYATARGYADNIPGRVLKIDMLESLIIGLERRTKPIARLLRDLESPYSSSKRREMLGILRTRYMHNNTQEQTVDYLKMSKTCYLDRRKQLVRLAVRYMGLDLLKTRPKSDLKLDLFFGNRAFTIKLVLVCAPAG